MPEHPSHNAPLSNAWILDLDMTLALIGDRDPYNASTCDQDALNAPVADVILSLQHCHPGYQTIILTGRPLQHSDPTQRWLEAHHIHYDQLIMRQDGDWTAGAFFKWGVYQRYIKDRFTIHAVFEDNPVVCRMWQEAGLPVFQVGRPASIDVKI